MRTKHLSVLIQIRIKGEVGTVRYAYTLQYTFLLTVPSGASFMDRFDYFC